MGDSAVSRAARKLAAAAPSAVVSLAVRVREVVAPQPWPFDDAAVQLHECERRGRGPLPYPPYLYGLLAAARTANAAGVKAFTAVEFGVAGGNGLRAMREHADLVGRRYSLDITVVGLDSGAGLLAASDPRDCAFALVEGEYAMDRAALADRLERAELILGDVTGTVGPLVERIAGGELPPLGFVSHDLDVFTGTYAALEAIATLPAQRTLPRVPMYFDDLSGYPYTDVTGERAAIEEFNAKNDIRRVGKIENLEHSLGGSARWANWPRHVFVLHAFDHPRYNERERATMVDLGLRADLRDIGSPSRTSH